MGNNGTPLTQTPPTCVPSGDLCVIQRVGALALRLHVYRGAAYCNGLFAGNGLTQQTRRKVTESAHDCTGDSSLVACIHVSSRRCHSLTHSLTHLSVVDP